jgi:hypothetical protein
MAVNFLMSLAVWRHLGIKAFAGKVKIVLWGGIVALAFFLTEPFLGIIGRLVVIFLGYRKMLEFHKVETGFSQETAKCSKIAPVGMPYN